jgi:polyphosphate glucokinase
MVARVKEAIAGQKYDAVSIGYPGPVVNGQPANEPKNLARGWVRFDYKKAFGKPVRIINDAAMQALGSHQGGRMLFLGLGTGLGSALVVDGVVAPLELAHLPYRRGTYEDYVGLRGYERMGRRKWEKHVHVVVELLKHALQVDYVVLGGGQTKKLKSVPKGARVGVSVGPDGTLMGSLAPLIAILRLVPPMSMTRIFIVLSARLLGPPYSPPLHSGVFHPPTSFVSSSASFGPQVPGSYSYIGLGPWMTGSTIAHAASTTSWRAKSVASPAMASPSSRS